MTCIVVEGFDHMTSVSLLDSKFWDFTARAVGAYVWTPYFAPGRVMGNAFGLASPTAEVVTALMLRTLPKPYTNIVCGFAFNYSHVPAVGSSGYLWQFYNPSGTGIAVVGVSMDGRLQIWSGGGVVAQSAPMLLTAATWHYCEVALQISGATSTVTAQLDGANVIASTTYNFGTAGVQFFGPYSESNNGWDPNNAPFLLYDDVYLFDATAPPNNAFVGDVRVETIYPAADGDETGWAPDTGTAHFSRVNEHFAGSGAPPFGGASPPTQPIAPDGDASYVRANLVGAKDSYHCTPLSITSGTIYAVQTNLYARKQDAATHTLHSLVRQAAADYEGPDHVLAVGYTDVIDMWQTDPSTSAAWTVAGVNSAQFGQKLVT